MQYLVVANKSNPPTCRRAKHKNHSISRRGTLRAAKKDNQKSGSTLTNFAADKLVFMQGDIIPDDMGHQVI